MIDEGTVVLAELRLSAMAREEEEDEAAAAAEPPPEGGSRCGCRFSPDDDDDDTGGPLRLTGAARLAREAIEPPTRETPSAPSPPSSFCLEFVADTRAFASSDDDLWLVESVAGMCTTVALRTAVAAVAAAEEISVVAVVRRDASLGVWAGGEERA